MVLSTCLSDLVLALSCVGCALWLLRQAESTRRYAALGMMLMACASAVGALRFGGVEQLGPLGEIATLHALSSRLAGGVAPANFALVALLLSGAPREREGRGLSLALAGVVLAWIVFELVLNIAAYRTVIGALALVCMLGVALARRTRAAGSLGLGALCLGLAGLVIGSSGELGPFLAVDVFHVVLALAHGLIAAGLVGLARAQSDRAPVG